MVSTVLPQETNLLSPTSLRLLSQYSKLFSTLPPSTSQLWSLGPFIRHSFLISRFVTKFLAEWGTTTSSFLFTHQHWLKRLSGQMCYICGLYCCTICWSSLIKWFGYVLVVHKFFLQCCGLLLYPCWFFFSLGFIIFFRLNFVLSQFLCLLSLDIYGREMSVKKWNLLCLESIV